ncbi:ubiquitin-conjugating enzyme [Aspergillus heteromorphus CBS 117.55]|uniref:Ubiquitin-conjugating enzyme n=1 Tax=Aspergillus heteromorphus CBS 117.55 TaxID=1448321 RepID=A0A317X088_9EURO|nr:ubiquitin-conjugating enzyme [Aspergillus heteromorphus CBS 117.55]PWY92059.1 ubiquitin-conjugating enzyme [Aspergillus heteromorphus CBS 117.55]
MDPTGASPAAAPITGAARAPKFELDDACYLKSNPSVVGAVHKTHHDINTHEPPDDYLVVSYTAISGDVLAGFLETGVPPKGYVFVGFAKFSQGFSLVHEDDLELIDRPIEIGEVVKRHPDDTMTGMVISASAKCTLEPIAFRPHDPSIGDFGSLEFTEQRAGNSSKEGAPRPLLLHDIPLDELVDHELYTEGDFIMCQQKLGIIRHVERDAIMCVENKPVWIVNPSVLEIPVRFEDKGLIWMPKHQPSETWDALEYFFEYDYVCAGQCVRTPAKNMRVIDSVHGLTADFDLEPFGHVLATPPTEFEIEWVAPNVFGMPATNVHQDMERLRASAVLGKAQKCDFGLVPTGSAVKSDTWIKIGDRVRFRRPAEAAQKYPSYHPIPTAESFGYDLNVFRVTSSMTELTVRWQDGSITTENSISVRRFYGFNDDVAVGELVVLKDGIEELPPLESNPRFPFFQSLTGHMKETLRARTVGVVQAVDSREQIASVRWYKQPDVDLLHGGQLLRPGSCLGELDETVSQVSLYEISTHACLSRVPGDLVLLPPSTVPRATLGTLQFQDEPRIAGSGNFSYLSPIEFVHRCYYFELMKKDMVNTEWFKSTTTIDDSPLPSRYSFHQDGNFNRASGSFVAQIVSTDTSGVITVRLAGSECRDICIPFEKIMMVIDDTEVLPPPLSPAELLQMGALNPWDMQNDPSLQATYEYEGGERLDEGEEDEWLTEDDADDMNDAPLVQGDHIAPDVAEIRLPDHADVEMSEVDPDDTEDRDTVAQDRETPDASPLTPSASPPGFLMLEGLPPSDHHFISEDATGASGPRIKRIRKELQILGTSLPPGIFVRTWESRMDLLRILIIGPQGTPYEYTPILIDLHFSPDFPHKPPATFFHSWTNGQGRINPNLYENGKICLSILGTWPTQNPEEQWSPSKSTVLQVLVSIMGLVLVKDPFYNEAGYEAFAAEGDRRVESTQYTERTFLMTRKFIKHALEHPIPGLEDVLTWNYLPNPADSSDGSRPWLLRRAIEAALRMIEHYNNNSGGDGDDSRASAFVSRLSLGAVVMLRKHITDLEKMEASLTSQAC